MREKLVYIVTTERISHKGDGGSIGSVWSYNSYYAKMYAAAFMAQDSSVFEYTSTICQYDPNNNYDPDIIPANNQKNMLKIVTNYIGEQFILTENIENNAYNAGAFKLIQNKYLDAFGDYFNKNGAGALFATVHSVITLLRPVLKNKPLVECMGKIIEWLLNRDEVKLDYFTYHTMTDKAIRKYKIGVDEDVERRGTECYM